MEHFLVLGHDGRLLLGTLIDSSMGQSCQNGLFHAISGHPVPTGGWEVQILITGRGPLGGESEHGSALSKCPRFFEIRAFHYMQVKTIRRYAIAANRTFLIGSGIVH